MSGDRLTDLTQIEDAAVQDTWSALDTLHDLLDGKFGDAYSAKHPAMLAGCVQACAIFYLAGRLSTDTVLTDKLATLADLLATRLDSLDNAVDNLLGHERSESVGTDGGKGRP